VVEAAEALLQQVLVDKALHLVELLLGVQVQQVLVLLESLDQEMVSVQVVYNILQVVVEAVEILEVLVE
jgi:hypothetical protein